MADLTIDALEFEAARGDPDAQTELATLYEHAQGVPRDVQRAGALYCQAARSGFAEAQFKLGWMHANARGVPRNDAVASALFEMAAKQGHPDATKLLVHIRASNRELPECLAPYPPILLANDRPFEIEMPPEPAFAAAVPLTPIERLVYQFAPRYEVDPLLALAVISVESDFNPTAVSPKNAQGLMQLIPQTAQRFGVKRVFDPADNINGGLAYLRWLLAFFQGDVPLVLAAYNAGEGAVERYRGIPPYQETRRYVKRITGMYTKAKHPYQAHIVEPSTVFARAGRTRS